MNGNRSCRRSVRAPHRDHLLDAVTVAGEQARGLLERVPAGDHRPQRFGPPVELEQRGGGGLVVGARRLGPPPAPRSRRRRARPHPPPRRRVSIAPSRPTGPASSTTAVLPSGGPGQAPLDGEQLLQRLLGDGERLGEHGHAAQLGGRRRRDGSRAARRDGAPIGTTRSPGRTQLTAPPASTTSCRPKSTSTPPPASSPTEPGGHPGRPGALHTLATMGTGLPKSQDIPTSPTPRCGASRLRGIRVDRPVVYEAVVAPDVPPLPPHITSGHATATGRALLKGDPDGGAIVRQTLVTRSRSFCHAEPSPSRRRRPTGRKDSSRFRFAFPGPPRYGGGGAVDSCPRMGGICAPPECCESGPVCPPRSRSIPRSIPRELPYV